MQVALNMWNTSNKKVPGKFSQEYKYTWKLKHAVNSAYKSNQIYDPLESQNLISAMLLDGKLSS